MKNKENVTLLQNKDNQQGPPLRCLHVKMIRQRLLNHVMTLYKVKDNMPMMNENMGYLSREVENVEKNQLESLELKNILSKT